MASLSLADQQSIACFSHLSQLPLLQTTQAKAIVTTQSLAQFCCLPHIKVLCVPSIAERLLSVFKQKHLQLVYQEKEDFIHDTAVIADSTMIGKHVYIGPHVVIGAGVCIGDGCVINANSVLAERVILKNNVHLAHGVKLLSDTLIENGCVIDAGTVIGSSPYNPVKERGRWLLSQPVGRVIIEQNTRIGANTTIDRGVFSDTRIGAYVVIDNLVQIAHDVVVEDNTVIAASAIIGANTIIGEHCTIGGGSSIAGQLTIANDVVLTGRTTVSRSLLKPGIYSSGVTAEPHEKWRRNVARFHRLDSSIKELMKLKKYIAESKVDE